MASAEIQHLKEIAAKLGLEHSPNIGAETLLNKIRDFCMQTGMSLEDESLEGIFSESAITVANTSEANTSNMNNLSSESNSMKNTDTSRAEIEKLSKLTFEGAAKVHAQEEKMTVQKKAMKLVRCRIACNNPNKRSYQGEIFAVRNNVIPEVKKFIPFNVATHVPQIILNMIQEKQLQTFISKRLPNGIETKVTKLVPEYNIEILPPLTAEEFNAIKQKQLAEGNDND